MIGRSSRARHRTVTASNRGDLTRPQTQQELNERFTVSLLPPKEVALSDSPYSSMGSEPGNRLFASCAFA